MHISFNDYLKEKYNCRVWKIPIDAGFTCPNRDGTLSDKGCIFCSEDGSSSKLYKTKLSIKEQIIKGIEIKKKSRNAKKFIAYFQSFSNTYAPVQKLKQIYDEVLNFEEIIMMAIGTRPDCLNQENIELIASYSKNLEIWLDLGLQSANNSSLSFVNRGHSAEDFAKAVLLVKKLAPKVKICSHIIIGLAQEKEEDFLFTIDFLNKLPIDGIKIHNLYILKNTPLENLYKTGEINVLTMYEYIEILKKIFKVLRKDIIIHRLMAESSSQEELITPDWTLNKHFFLSELSKALKN